MFKGKLINSGLNAKTIKGDGEYITAIMYMAPATSLQGVNVCPMAEKAGCIDACLYTAGRGAMNVVQQARLRKTMFYRDKRTEFMATLVDDLERFVRHCQKKGAMPACRLNGTSDIQWERYHVCYRNGERFESIFEAFPEVTFYDYTKIYKRVYRDLPDNYHLVLSYSEADHKYAAATVQAHRDTGANMAVVYRSREQVEHILSHSLAQYGSPVVDGDKTDLRFQDGQGVIIALYAKGKSARQDQSGFVVDL